mmetsp:Transcript_13961/g.33768  ORF Transcript_13961/g.33768 Transcript_13961/m.33768 type:complete len:90 (+) Transcript_13961:150-419(+)
MQETVATPRFFLLEIWQFIHHFISFYWSFLVQVVALVVMSLLLHSSNSRYSSSPHSSSPPGQGKAAMTSKTNSDRSDGRSTLHSSSGLT